MNTARVPQFIGIGAQKAATSWIHACLYQHPQTFLPATKEIHFFSRHYEKGADWYERHFQDSKPGQIVGEFSPSYLYDPNAADRIHAWEARVKLLACLRNPVDRAVSAYAYAVTEGQKAEVESIGDFFRGRPDFLRQGLYYEQLERYLRFFERDQLLVTIYDDISNSPLAFIQTIYRFVGVAPDFTPPAVSKRVNKSFGAPRSSGFYAALRFGADTLRVMGFERAVWRFARSPLGELLKRASHRTGSRGSLSSQDWDELVTYFESDVRELSRLLKRDLMTLWFARSTPDGRDAGSG